jgi:hypothetical protein
LGDSFGFCCLLGKTFLLSGLEILLLLSEESFFLLGFFLLFQHLSLLFHVLHGGKGSDATSNNGSTGEHHFLFIFFI